MMHVRYDFDLLWYTGNLSWKISWKLYCLTNKSFGWLRLQVTSYSGRLAIYDGNSYGNYIL